MSTKTKNLGVRTVIHFIIMCLLMYLIGTANPITPITSAGMQMLGVFVGCIYGWLTIGMILPSLLGIFLLGFNEMLTPDSAVAGSFGNSTVINLLLLFALIQLVQDEKVPDFIATWSLSRKAIQGKPILYSWVILVLAAVLGMVNVFLSIFVLWSILYGMLDKLGYKKREAYSSIMLCGVVMFSMMGLIIFPFVDNGLIIMASYAGITGTPMPYIPYIIVMVPITLVMALVWVLVGKFVFHMDMSKLKNVDSTMLNLDLLKTTKRQKATMAMIVLYVVIILMQALLPDNIPVLRFLCSSNLYAVIFIVIVIGVLWHIDGQPLMDVKSLLSRGVIWETWLLTAFVLLLTSYLTSEGTGITAFCVTKLQPLLGGLSLYAMVVIVMLFAFIVTNLANNIVVTLCVIPIMFAFSQSMGFAIEPIALVIMAASHLALLTPGASGPAAVMFANEDWIGKKDIYKYIPVLLVAMLIVDLTVGYLWANVIF